MSSRDYPAPAKPHQDNQSSLGPQHKKGIDNGENIHLIASRVTEAGSVILEEENRLVKLQENSFGSSQDEQPFSTREDITGKMKPGFHRVV